VRQDTARWAYRCCYVKIRGSALRAQTNIHHHGNFMKEDDLKAENTALRKQNKNLKALLEEALEIIRKLKEFVDSVPGARAAAGKKSVPTKTARKKTTRKAKSPGKSS
jgi:hypothetical protein